MDNEEKDKEIPILAWTGPEGSRKWRLLEFRENRQVKMAKVIVVK